MRRDYIEKARAIARELFLADSRDRGHRCKGIWAGDGHFANSRIVKDNVGWYRLRFGKTAAMGPQSLEESFVFGPQGYDQACTGLTLATCRRCQGNFRIMTKLDDLLAAENWAGSGCELEGAIALAVLPELVLAR